MLLAVVAVASRAHRLGGGVGHAHGVPPGLFNYAFTLLLLGMVATCVLVAWLYLDGRHYKQRKPSNARQVRKLVTTIAVFAAMFAFFGGGKHTFSWLHIHRPHLNDVRGGKRLHGKNTKDAQPAGAPQFRWAVAGVLVLLVGGMLAASVASNRRRHGRTREQILAEALAEVVADTLDDLRAERDPRRAIIAAYARMERVLAAHDVERHPAETPFEYLERVLLDLRLAPNPVRTLTDLFERAKFSRQELDTRAKESAITALETIRDELATPPVVAAA